VAITSHNVTLHRCPDIPLESAVSLHKEWPSSETARSVMGIVVPRCKLVTPRNSIRLEIENWIVQSGVSVEKSRQRRA
jgi:hypothetical protein